MQPEDQWHRSVEPRWDVHDHRAAAIAEADLMPALARWQRRLGRQARQQRRSDANPRQGDVYMHMASL
jgi:hypothetical protein